MQALTTLQEERSINIGYNNTYTGPHTNTRNTTKKNPLQWDTAVQTGPLSKNWNYEHGSRAVSVNNKFKHHDHTGRKMYSDAIWRNSKGNNLQKVLLENVLQVRKSSGSCREYREHGRRDPSRWPRGTLYPQKVGNHFDDNRRSLGRYSSFVDSDHGV
jgi:hypothetical protein